MRRAEPAAVEPLISMAEVAERLDVPLKTFRRWRLHKQTPLGYKLGGQVKFRWSEVEAWLQQQREQDELQPRRLVDQRKRA